MPGPIPKSSYRSLVPAVLDIAVVCCTYCTYSELQERGVVTPAAQVSEPVVLRSEAVQAVPGVIECAIAVDDLLHH